MRALKLERNYGETRTQTNQTMQTNERFLNRLLAKVQFTETCWLWTASTDGNGYGKLYAGKKPDGRLYFVSAHRALFEICNGAVPAGLVLDHLCQVLTCVRPDHLEAVTNRTNILRGHNPAAIRARQTHCSKGHPLTGDNLTVTKKHPRRCRICFNEWNRRKYHDHFSRAARSSRLT